MMKNIILLFLLVSSTLVAKTPLNDKEIAKWKKVGIYKQYIHNWTDIGLNAKQAGEWKNIGEGYYQVGRYMNEFKFKSAKEFIPYKDLGQKTNYSLSWNFNLYQILATNIKPDDLFVSIINNADYYSTKNIRDAYNILKKNGCKKLEANHYPNHRKDFSSPIGFAEADEYDNEGKCYVFHAKMLQRLDRTNGLASNKYGEIFYAIFNKSWSDGIPKSGYIKGLGNYRYQTTSGSMKNVPQGKVLMFNQR